MFAKRMMTSGLLAALVSTPAIAQRYAEEDASGSINLWIWGAFIAYGLYRFARNRIRHWLDPQKAEAEDKAEEAKGRAVRQYHDDQFEASQKEWRAKEEAQRAKEVLARGAAGGQLTAADAAALRAHLQRGVPVRREPGDSGGNKD